MEKFIEYLEQAEKKLKTADHMAHVTYPLIKEKRLLLKILTEINIVILSCINSILQYEYLYKRIPLTKDANTNLRIFKERCAPRYKIEQEDIAKIIQIITLTEKHKKSPFEFIKEEKVVILSGNMEQSIINLEKIKDFLIIAKKILKKAKEGIQVHNKKV